MDHNAGGQGQRGQLCASSMRRKVGDTHAAERRTWNSKPSEETRVTKGEGVPSRIMIGEEGVRDVQGEGIESRDVWRKSG